MFMRAVQIDSKQSRRVGRYKENNHKDETDSVLRRHTLCHTLKSSLRLRYSHFTSSHARTCFVSNLVNEN
ncbi:hypothetical protein T09_2314 [Trichinella sp. T9]|nr:hypothetical protein T09_2314 [Trichinella sp. T9]